jgi:hypothetical protein
MSMTSNVTEKKFECIRCGSTRNLKKIGSGLICRECLAEIEICDHCGGIVGEGESGRCPICGGP